MGLSPVRGPVAIVVAFGIIFGISGVAGVTLAGCGGGNRQYSVGLPLDSLPRAGGASLVALTPAPAVLVAAIQNPLHAWDAVERSGLAAQLAAAGLLEDDSAWPWLERWRVLRGRLGELSRQPIPELRQLLEAPAVVSLSAEGGWLYAARIASGPTLAFAAALNGVHPSGRDVELERRHGIPVRLVRFGDRRLAYYVLADRFVVSDDVALLQRSLELVFSNDAKASARSVPSFAALESRAESSEFALAVDGVHAPAVFSALGLRSLNGTGRAISVDFDPERWGAPSLGDPPGPDSGSSGLSLQVDLSGLQGASLWQSMRPAAAPSALIATMDAVATRLGRGIWLRADQEAGGRIGVALWFSLAGDGSGAGDTSLEDLARQLLAHPERETLAGGGASWCGAGGGLCLVSCARFVGLTNRKDGPGACPGDPGPARAAGPWLAFEVASAGKSLFQGAVAPRGGDLRWAEK
jgi:hypothetical protein